MQAGGRLGYGLGDSSDQDNDNGLSQLNRIHIERHVHSPTSESGDDKQQQCSQEAPESSTVHLPSVMGYGIISSVMLA
jgi:hypothetical protein